MIERLRDIGMLVFGVIALGLLMIYNRTRVYWRPTRRFSIVPDHIPVVDAIVTASEWFVFALMLIVVVGLSFEWLRGFIAG